MKLYQIIFYTTGIALQWIALSHMSCAASPPVSSLPTSCACGIFIFSQCYFYFHCDIEKTFLEYCQHIKVATQVLRNSTLSGFHSKASPFKVSYYLQFYELFMKIWKQFSMVTLTCVSQKYSLGFRISFDAFLGFVVQWHSKNIAFLSRCHFLLKGILLGYFPRNTF